MIATAPSFPTPPPREVGLLAQLEDLRDRYGSLALVAHLAALEDRAAMHARQRLERGPADAAALLAKGLQAFGPQFRAAAEQLGVVTPRPEREDADRQAWSGHRARVRG